MEVRQSSNEIDERQKLKKAGKVLTKTKRHRNDWKKYINC
jgi:hypothetical protein